MEGLQRCLIISPDYEIRKTLLSFSNPACSKTDKDQELKTIKLPTVLALSLTLNEPQTYLKNSLFLNRFLYLRGSPDLIFKISSNRLHIKESSSLYELKHFSSLSVGSFYISILDFFWALRTLWVG